MKDSSFDDLARRAKGPYVDALLRMNKSLLRPSLRSDSFLDTVRVISGGSLITGMDQFANFSKFLPKAIELPALRISTDLARMLGGASAITAIGESTQIARTLRAMSQSIAVPDIAFAKVWPQHETELNRLAENLRISTRWIAQAHIPNELQRVAELSTRAWRLVVAELPGATEPIWFQRASAAGLDSLTTAKAVELLGGSEPDFDLPEPESGELTLPSDLRTKLRKTLQDLDVNLVRRLDGAWECVGAVGVDAASQACHSVQELMDWTLRLSAPDELVIPWHTETQRNVSELIDGKPTRVLRAKFMLRNRAADSTAARLYLRSINDLVGALQKGKHSLVAAHTPHAVGCLLVTLEGLLAFLLLE